MRDAPAVRYGELLRNREFSALLFAQVISGLGDQIARLALALLVLEQTGSASASAATFAVSYLPMLFGGTVLGPLADRFPRRTIMLVADGTRVLAIGALALLANGSTTIVVLFILLFAAELLTPLFDAAWAATLPEVLPDGAQYLAGSGLLRTLHYLQQVAGLGVGAILVTLLGVRGALILDALTFAVSFVVLWVFLARRPSPTDQRPSQGLFADFGIGVRDLFADPVRRMLVAVGWGSVVPMIIPMAVALPYAGQVAGRPELGGLLMAATVGGSAIGTLIVTRRPPREQIDLILPLATAACLPLLAVALAPPLPVALVLWAVSGAATGFLVPLIGTIAFITAPELRGRIMALAGAGYNGLIAITYLFAGFVADLAAPSVAVTVAGVMGLVLVAVARILWPTRAMRRAVAEAYDEPALSVDVDDDRFASVAADDDVTVLTSAPDDPDPEPLPPREQRVRERTYVETIEIVLPQSPVDVDGAAGRDPRQPF